MWRSDAARRFVAVTSGAAALALSGCAVVAVAGAAISVTGAVIGTTVKVTGKLIGAAVDVVTPGSQPAP